MLRKENGAFKSRYAHPFLLSLRPGLGVYKVTPETIWNFIRLRR